MNTRNDSVKNYCMVRSIEKASTIAPLLRKIIL